MMSARKNGRPTVYGLRYTIDEDIADDELFLKNEIYLKLKLYY